MKRKADASPGGDGNNESALNAGLPGTTCRRPHNKRSVSFQDDRILDEVELEKDKASLERRGGSPSSSFSQEPTPSVDYDEAIDEVVEDEESEEESNNAEEEGKERQHHQQQNDVYLWNSRSIEWMIPPRYKLIKPLGHGSYGMVIKGQDTEANNRDVAIKRVENVFAVASDAKRIYREIYILRKLNHPQIIGLLDVFTPNSFENLKDIYLVFECMETDLYKLIQSSQFLTDDHIQAIIYQLLVGIRYIHAACVIHRDLKPANILLRANCSVKICDFGMSRVVDPEFISMKSTRDEDGSCVQGMDETEEDSEDTCSISSGTATFAPPIKLRRKLTQHVVTRWYRAPELILMQDYNSAVDVWSLGCIFAELLGMQKESVADHQCRVPLFPGKSCFPLSVDDPTSYEDRLDQLNVILSVIGTPKPEDIIDAVGDVHRHMDQLENHSKVDLASLYPGAKQEVLELVSSMLKFNAKKRICLDEALRHKYLSAINKLNPSHQHISPIMGLENMNNIDRSVIKQRIYDLITLT